jgi:hypothetical protein
MDLVIQPGAGDELNGALHIAMRFGLFVYQALFAEFWH